MKIKSFILFSLSFAFLAVLVGCQSTPQAPLQDPATVLLANGFETQPTDLCATPCTKYWKGSVGDWTALVFTNGTFDFFYSGQSNYKPPFDLMQTVLTGIYPSNLANKIVSLSKDFKSGKGTTGNYDWFVDVNDTGTEVSIGIGIKPNK